MRWFKRRKQQQKQQIAPIHVSLQDVKRAVLQFENDMPEQIQRTTLLTEDQSIDLKRISRYLGGVSDQKFYMSRYTYEIFEENDKLIPLYLDMVQSAVDDYMDEHPDLPVMTGTRNRQVHYDLLMQRHYLKEKPPIPLYLTTEQFLLTHEPDWHRSELTQ
ncbi:DUF3939 domain-containing protein [Paenibacillus apiarius]|uniref:DUF3939 domain-containing protein n=1 Tax=Paenibacillus apiarius TaxID=46240 RepID=A0ABT4DMA2_9BACL|nr:DUF3939 domain-containing protein [Paenibacillus apiarius]MBN3526305.1 DUF3939 domain-containing protein [Paenibacillus apiarius]MCY9516060.1 DUF3939 domain-containing protein [Paenibacillus apiarius]MCY9518481.1 DUF3939 domain-containing protein [Paenibacillus apiarius]MCY9551118.1 DUF3939 domain-containing protein [Paenibacillus apiarius]MCY9558272.1 DUF3939 domain-containing protein [Paenibacillus apiarius]